MNSNTPNLVNQIDHYVIMISAHNVAELKSCLYFKPKNIYAIVTERKEIESAFDKFKKTIEDLQRDQILDNSIKLHKLSSTEQDILKGELYENTIDWIENFFIPNYCEKKFKNSNSVVFNMTGATKLLSLLILQSYKWDYVFYQPYSSNEPEQNINIFTLENINGSHKINFSHTTIINLKEITGVENIPAKYRLQLYADAVSRKSNNPISNIDRNIVIAEKRFLAQKDSHDKEIKILSNILKKFEELWFNDINKNTDNNIIHKINFKEIFATDNDLDFDLINSVLTELYSIDNHALELFKEFENNKENNIYIPNIHHKDFNNWIRWINGEWFEQLIKHWLIKLNIVEKHNISSSLSIVHGSSSGYETDIIIEHSDTLYVLELKSDITPEFGQSVKDFISQSALQTQLIGKYKACLVLSSYIRDYHYEMSKIGQNKNKTPKQQQWISFENNCKGKGIKLIIVDKKEDLLELFK